MKPIQLKLKQKLKKIIEIKIRRVNLRRTDKKLMKFLV